MSNGEKFTLAEWQYRMKHAMPAYDELIEALEASLFHIYGHIARLEGLSAFRDASDATKLAHEIENMIRQAKGEAG